MTDLLLTLNIVTVSCAIKTNALFEEFIKCVKLAWSLEPGIRFIPCKEGF